MSRQIDPDNLTADDATYLQQYPWLINEAKLQGVDDIEERIEEALASQPEPEPYEGLKLPELKQEALSKGVDLGDAKTVKAIKAKLIADDEEKAANAKDPNEPDHTLGQ